MNPPISEDLLERPTSHLPLHFILLKLTRFPVELGFIIKIDDPLS